MAGFDPSSRDDFNIWQIGPDPDRLPGSRRSTFQALGDGPFGAPIHLQPVENYVQRRVQDDDGEDSSQAKVINVVTGYAHLVCENVLSHPFLVLRRQCQVSRRSIRYHLTPFTVFVVTAKIQNLHGIGSLWKGLGSVLVVRGLQILAEGCIAEVTSLPKDLTNTKLTPEIVAKHLTLKALALIIVTPFFCSSLVETVQSTVSCESPGVFDCIKEGFWRGQHWQMTRSSRLLPIWLLCVPYVVNGICHYTIYSMTKSFYLWIAHYKIDDGAEQRPEAPVSQHNEIMSTLFGNFSADVLMFPLETILCRLCLQGTRTIIDNVDQAGSVIPVISDYVGTSDCHRAILVDEGSLGLFKGFGALTLQYAFQYAFVKLTRVLIQQIVPNVKNM